MFHFPPHISYFISLSFGTLSFFNISLLSVFVLQQSIMENEASHAGFKEDPSVKPGSKPGSPRCRLSWVHLGSKSVSVIGVCMVCLLVCLYVVRSPRFFKSCLTYWLFRIHPKLSYLSFSPKSPDFLINIRYLEKLNQESICGSRL